MQRSLTSSDAPGIAGRVRLTADGLRAFLSVFLRVVLAVNAHAHESLTHAQRQRLVRRSTANVSWRSGRWISDT